MATNYNPQIVTNGLVLCLDAANPKSYPGTGTAWTNLSNLQNSGTLTNGPTFSTTNGGSIVFDGTDDYIAETTTLSGSFWQSNWSVSFWANLDTLSTTSTASFDKPLIHHGASGTRNGLHLVNRNSRLHFGLFGDDMLGVQTITTGTWYNFLFTLNNTTGLRQIYINGILDNSGTAGGAYTGTGTNTRIGGPIVFTSPYFDGFLSICQFYNRVLSAAEITQNFNALRSRYAI